MGITVCRPVWLVQRAKLNSHTAVQGGLCKCWVAIVPEVSEGRLRPVVSPDPRAQSSPLQPLLIQSCSTRAPERSNDPQPYCSDVQAPILPSLFTWRSPRCTEPGKAGSQAYRRAPGWPHPRPTQWSLVAAEHGAPGSALESLHCKGHSESCQVSAWLSMAGVTRTEQLRPWAQGTPSGEEIGQRHCHSAGLSVELVLGTGPLGHSEGT